MSCSFACVLTISLLQCVENIFQNLQFIYLISLHNFDNFTNNYVITKHLKYNYVIMVCYDNLNLMVLFGIFIQHFNIHIHI